MLIAFNVACCNWGPHQTFSSQPLLLVWFQFNSRGGFRLFLYLGSVCDEKIREGALEGLMRCFIGTFLAFESDFLHN